MNTEEQVNELMGKIEAEERRQKDLLGQAGYESGTEITKTGCKTTSGCISSSLYVLRTGEHGDGSYKECAKEEETVDCQRLFVTFFVSLAQKKCASRDDDAENQCYGGKNFDNS